MKVPAWSYSSLKLFDTCPRKYEAERITKEVPFTDTTATIYGKEFHLACEEFIRDGKPLPAPFVWMKDKLEKLKSIPGEKHCELKLGVKKEDGRLVACDFFDADVWFRGVADLVIVDDTKGWVLDYKTSKSSKYADLKQIALMSAALFLKFPQLEKIKGALLFAVAEDLVRAEYTRENALNIFADLHETLALREVSYYTRVFNEKPNGLCRKWCGVLSCPHNGANR